MTRTFIYFISTWFAIWNKSEALVANIPLSFENGANKQTISYHSKPYVLSRDANLARNPKSWNDANADDVILITEGDVRVSETLDVSNVLKDLLKDNDKNTRNLAYGLDTTAQAIYNNLVDEFYMLVTNDIMSKYGQFDIISSRAGDDIILLDEDNPISDEIEYNVTAGQSVIGRGNDVIVDYMVFGDSPKFDFHDQSSRMEKKDKSLEKNYQGTENELEKAWENQNQYSEGLKTWENQYLEGLKTWENQYSEGLTTYSSNLNYLKPTLPTVTKVNTSPYTKTNVNTSPSNVNTAPYTVTNVNTSPYKYLWFKDNLSPNNETNLFELILKKQNFSAQRNGRIKREAKSYQEKDIENEQKIDENNIDVLNENENNIEVTDESENFEIAEDDNSLDYEYEDYYELSDRTGKELDILIHPGSPEITGRMRKHRRRKGGRKRKTRRNKKRKIKNRRKKKRRKKGNRNKKGKRRKCYRRCQRIRRRRRKQDNKLSLKNDEIITIGDRKKRSNIKPVALVFGASSLSRVGEAQLVTERVGRSIISDFELGPIIVEKEKSSEPMASNIKGTVTLKVGKNGYLSLKKLRIDRPDADNKDKTLKWKLSARQRRKHPVAKIKPMITRALISAAKDVLESDHSIHV